MVNILSLLLPQFLNLIFPMHHFILTQYSVSDYPFR